MASAMAKNKTWPLISALIMPFLRKWIAAYLFGRAIMGFYQQRYKNTIRLLEKVRKLDPDNEKNELFCSYLGRSYLALERYDDALEMMSRSDNGGSGLLF